MLRRTPLSSFSSSSFPISSSSSLLLLSNNNKGGIFNKTRTLFSWKTPNNPGSNNNSTTTPKKPIINNSSSSPSSNTTKTTTRINPLASNSSKAKIQQQQQAAKQKQKETLEENTTSTAQRILDKIKGFWKNTPTVKELVLVHGPGFGTWYFILNTAIQLAIASVLYYELAGHLIESRELAVKLGVVDKFDAYANQTYYLLKSPIAVNGRFIANYIVVATLMAPVIPVKISWSLATYPFVLKCIPKGFRPSFNKAATVVKKAK